MVVCCISAANKDHLKHSRHFEKRSFCVQLNDQNMKSAFLVKAAESFHFAHLLTLSWLLSLSLSLSTHLLTFCISVCRVWTDVSNIFFFIPFVLWKYTISLLLRTTVSFFSWFHTIMSGPAILQPKWSTSVIQWVFKSKSYSSASYSCCDGPMFLSFIINHPDPSTLEHPLHLLWSGCGGKVHIFRSLPRQQVPYSTSCNPQLMLVLLKQLWEEQIHT